MTTIAQLKDWMLANNIKNTYTSSGRYVTDEGLGLEEVYGTYVWYFIERGIRQDLEIFRSEADAVQYIHDYLVKNKE